MKKFSLTALGALLVSGVAMAESWTGDIVFNGSITAGTCKFESSSTVDSHNIYVNMGSVAADVVTPSLAYAPIFSAAVIASNGTSAMVKCSGTAKGLSMKLKPKPGEGTPTLPVTGGAKGVGIALYDSITSRTPWMLQDKVVFTKTAAELAAANAAGGIPVKFAAAYVRFDTLYPAVIPGAANAVLPFEMSYE